MEQSGNSHGVFLLNSNAMGKPDICFQLMKQGLFIYLFIYLFVCKVAVY